MIHPAMRIETARVRLLSWSAALGLLAGCAVGPNFKTPAPPHTAGYVPAGQLPPATAASPTPEGAAQQFVDGLDIPGQWWTRTVPPWKRPRRH
jgi:hypothetical protein